MKQEVRRMDEQLPAIPCSEATPSQENVWCAKVVENVTVPPRCKQIIVKQIIEKQNPPPLVCIEPAQIPIEGILPARGLSRVKTGRPPPSVTSSHSSNISRTRNSQAMVMVANFSDEQISIPNATVLCVAEEIREELVDIINQRDQPISDPLNNKQRKKRNELLYKKLPRGKLDHLPVKDRQLIEPVLLKYPHLFHDEQIND